MTPDALSNERDQLSRVRNAARGVADCYLRFERDMDRLRRTVREAGEAGILPNEVLRAVQEGVGTDAHRVRAFGVIHDRILRRPGA